MKINSIDSKIFVVYKHTIKKYSTSKKMYNNYFWMFKEEYETYCSRVTK